MREIVLPIDQDLAHINEFSDPAYDSLEVYYPMTLLTDLPCRKTLARNSNAVLRFVLPHSEPCLRTLTKPPLTEQLKEGHAFPLKKFTKDLLYTYGVIVNARRFVDGWDLALWYASTTIKTAFGYP